MHIKITETINRKATKYYTITDEFYVEVKESYENPEFNEMWLCRKNYGFKAFVVGIKEKITLDLIMSELGLGSWDDNGVSLIMYMSKLLDENETFDKDGNIIYR